MLLSLSLSVFSRLFQSRDIDDAKCLKQYIANVSTKGTAAAYANTILSLFIWRSMTSSSNKSSRFSKALTCASWSCCHRSFVNSLPSISPSSKSKSSSRVMVVVVPQEGVRIVIVSHHNRQKRKDIWILDVWIFLPGSRSDAK